jgi:hypothetical protein
MAFSTSGCRARIRYAKTFTSRSTRWDAVNRARIARRAAIARPATFTRTCRHSSSCSP